MERKTVLTILLHLTLIFLYFIRFFFFWTSLVAQMVRNLPTKQETWI